MLTRVFGVAVSGVVACLFLGNAVAQEAKAKKIVVIEADADKGSITLDEIAHIRPGGIAGAESKVVVKGPAKHAMKNVPVKNKDGVQVIGPNSEMIEVTPTGKGTVEIRISTQNPTGGKAIERTVKLEVK